MAKPSIFSSNYKQQVKKRRLNTFLFILLLLCAGFFGGKYYMDKNNVSLAKKFENNKLVQSIHIPDFFGKIKGFFSKEEDGAKAADENKTPDNSGKVVAAPTKTPVKPVPTSIPTASTSAGVNTTEAAISTATGEYVYLAKNGYRFAVNYAKTGDKTVITGLKENSGTSEYCISQDKDMIVFDVKQDNSIILCDAAGTFKMLSRETYKSTTTGKLYDKTTVLKTYENYIWAQKPYFTTDKRVVYISRIPYFKSSKMLYLWSVSLDGKSHRKISKVGLDISKISYGGYDEENRLKVTADGTAQYLDIGSYMLRKY